MQCAQNALRIAAATIAALLLFAMPAVAGGLQVSPVTLELPAQGGASALYIVNQGAAPTSVQIEAFAWRQGKSGETLVASDAIAISPPLAQLKPGQRQTVRLVVKPDPSAAAERSFRLIVSELPGGARTHAVRMLLQFSVPVFAGDPNAAAKVEWRARPRPDGIWIIAHNAGTKRAKLRDLEFKVANKGLYKSKSPLAYVLAGATRIIKIPGTGFDLGAKIEIDARDHHNQMAQQASIVLAP
jgi:fimbrial chaperone protein